MVILLSNMKKTVNQQFSKKLPGQDMKETLPRHDIFKLSKTGDKEKILKATRENKTNHVQSNKDENGKQFQIENNVNEKIIHFL